jgi:hypothetical protein
MTLMCVFHSHQHTHYIPSPSTRITTAMTESTINSPATSLNNVPRPMVAFDSIPVRRVPHFRRDATSANVLSTMKLYGERYLVKELLDRFIKVRTSTKVDWADKEGVIWVSILQSRRLNLLKSIM